MYIYKMHLNDYQSVFLSCGLVVVKFTHIFLGGFGDTGVIILYHGPILSEAALKIWIK